MKKKKSGIKEIESENKTQTVGRWNYMAEPKKMRVKIVSGFQSNELEVKKNRMNYENGRRDKK